jgi:hypothetical protein
VTKLTELIEDRGMKFFAVIDQSAEARGVGLHLGLTTLIVFGNPAGGTAVMDATRSPLSTSPSRFSSGRMETRPRSPTSLRARSPTATPSTPTWHTISPG